MAETTNPTSGSDCLAPAQVAAKCESVGVAKCGLDWVSTLALGILAGVFIALGAVFMTTITAGAAALPFGVAKLLGGLVFCLGLILVVVAGAELFTGNNLIVVALLNGKVSLGRLLRNWGLVYLGNLIGSVVVAGLVFAARHYTGANGAIGANALAIANAKTGLAFGQAVALGVLCNALVCLAVWLTFSARSVAGKILAIIFPITAFVAAGFEHSVANMYFIPMGLIIKHFDPAFVAQTQASVNNLTVQGLLVRNLLPVTIGNIIGGAGLVGLVYWFIYLRPRRSATSTSVAER